MSSRRSRILARFTELEEERAAIGAQLTRLERDHQLAPDLDLLDPFPITADLMAGLPPRLHSQLNDVFGIELLYRHDSRRSPSAPPSPPAPLRPWPPSSASATACPQPWPPCFRIWNTTLGHPGSTVIMEGRRWLSRAERSPG
jgi:hypothetical protein